MSEDNYKCNHGDYTVTWKGKPENEFIGPSCPVCLLKRELDETIAQRNRLSRLIMDALEGILFRGEEVK